MNEACPQLDLAMVGRVGMRRAGCRSSCQALRTTTAVSGDGLSTFIR